MHYKCLNGMDQTSGIESLVLFCICIYILNVLIHLSVVLEDWRSAVLPTWSRSPRPHSAWWRLLQSNPEGAGQAYGRAARPAALRRTGQPRVPRSRAARWVFQLGLDEECCTTSSTGNKRRSERGVSYIKDRTEGTNFMCNRWCPVKCCSMYYV